MYRDTKPPLSVYILVENVSYMVSALSIAFVAFVIWLISKSHQDQLETERDRHREELKQTTNSLELKRLMDLQEFTARDTMLIHLQEKVIPDRLDEYLNIYDIQFLKGKPLSFDATYYAMLKKLGQ